jgi:hypothetical protein
MQSEYDTSLRLDSNAYTAILQVFFSVVGSLVCNPSFVLIAVQVGRGVCHETKKKEQD